MRLKNVKGADKVIEASKYIILKPEDYKGKWKEVFNNSNPIHIEIGMGKGDFIIGMAKNNPNINFIGIEMYDSVIVKAVNKLENEEINNIRLIRMDARLIEDVFDKEIDLIYLNFSDPWPKNRNAKRRLTHERFLNRYENIFKGKKTIFMKTDNIDLFSFSIESLSEYGYKLKNVSLDLHNSDFEGNVMTEYEKKFSSKGVRINRLEAYKD
ncbi:MAG: tRNA (guanosine(46)-N7)-methyltransferase TrmB [Bacilli bacterium]|nr:tRNA (guanosine(46)-N7)-methyltransferase TrmB [Bacilli bacterium]MBO6194804.1 tRNA (guanosine(46)-N7)-methyltransferase TrmB [Bacilli bacterium]